ncbi:MAG: NAD(P)-dependent oxidoreductase, partial [Muribaculaceae bacterium]|nr:NAD(P)-dependent oxidoreductase [Muribaculaceae bacterium]
FRSMVSEALGGRWVLPLKLPMWAVFAVSAVAEKIAAWRGKASTLNRDKYKIMKQRNWNCDVSDAQADFGFHADFPLERGVRATVDAYLAGKKKKSND